MKYLKMLGLAAIAALALTAFGAGSASAATHLCSTNTSPCTGTIYGAGTALSGKLKAGTNAVLTNSLDQVTCTSSSVSGEITEATNGAGNVTGKFTSVTFTGCTDQNGSNCTVETKNLPWHAEGTTEGTKSNGNGKLDVKSNGTGSPEAKVVCGGFLSCTFGTELATLGVTGGNPAFIKAAGINLGLISGFFCPSSATWDAEYEVTAPKPLYVI
jgi:hypothetical protein